MARPNRQSTKPRQLSITADHIQDRAPEQLKAHLAKAVAFVRAHGEELELARLDAVIAREPAHDHDKKRLVHAQLADGGFPAFWSGNISSLDATCFRLTQMEQVGFVRGDEVDRALDFLSHKQKSDGSWEESEELRSRTPPWVRPGDEQARLYLTANCGYWLGVLGARRDEAHKAASFLTGFLDERGRLPSFPHTHWLAAGLFVRARLERESQQVLRYLCHGIIESLEASNLGWLGVTLLVAGLPPNHPAITAAAARLRRLQETDGRWASEDGSDRDVHATLEAIRVLVATDESRPPRERTL